jgi:hypothetical protein
MTDSQHQYNRLVQEHRSLDEQIVAESRRPMPDSMKIVDLKKRKLAIKQRLESMVAA